MMIIDPEQEYLILLETKCPLENNQRRNLSSLVSIAWSNTFDPRWLVFLINEQGPTPTTALRTQPWVHFLFFFTQSPSFLAFQSDMQKNKRISNAQTLFNMDKIPSDNHIRNLMDEVPASKAYPMFHYVFNGIKESKQLDTFRSYGNNLGS